MTGTVRNVLIVLAIAAAVAFLPGAGLAADLVNYLLSLLFFGGLAWLAARLYVEHRIDLESLGDRGRLILYGAIGVAVLTIAATPRLWNTGPGTLVWFLLIGAASYALYMSYRAYRDLA